MARKQSRKKHLPKLKSTKAPSPPRGFTRRKIGSGITERSTITFTGPLDDKGAALLISTLDRAVHPYREIEETCRADLRRAGIPDNPTEEGKYPFRSHITPDLAKEAYHSLNWYSAAILDALAHGRWAAEAGDRRGIGYAEGEIKYLWRERYIKSEHEKSWEIGKRKQRKQANLAKRKHEKHQPVIDEKHHAWQTAANAVWAKNRRLSRSVVAKIIKHNLNLAVTAGWIQKNIKKPSYSS